MFESIFFRRKPLPKLYYTSSSCGAASFIAAYTAGVNLETEQVDLRTHKTVSGRNYYEINPKGNVPALVLEDGTLLNEGAAVLQYIADLVRLLMIQYYVFKLIYRANIIGSGEDCSFEWHNPTLSCSKPSQFHKFRTSSQYWCFVLSWFSTRCTDTSSRTCR